ncbi:MAG: cytochrome c family protein [Alphaproteobacteria bacterium]
MRHLLPIVGVVLLGLAAPVLAADAGRGERLYAACKACHTLNQGGLQTAGPNLHGFFGRPAAQAAGYNFSPALRNAGIVWDEASLDKYLADPRTAVPGTRMIYPGMRKPEDRADLIAYLKEATK